MKIAVIGVGFVGNAVSQFLQKNLHEIVDVDPKLSSTTVFDVRETCEAFILCLPTPSNEDGSCDDSIIRTVINQLDTHKPILLKSTVTPDLLDDYPSNVTYNPEFLRALHAEEDFKNQKHFILGGEDEQQLTIWKDVFTNLNASVVETNRTTASMIKYTHNAWLATKVAFFHEIFENGPNDMNYSELTSTLAQMTNIGPSHMIAPNFDGNLGYNGYCFPKDMKALTSCIDHSIIEQVMITNKKLNKRSI